MRGPEDGRKFRRMDVSKLRVTKVFVWFLDGADVGWMDWLDHDAQDEVRSHSRISHRG